MSEPKLNFSYEDTPITAVLAGRNMRLKSVRFVMTTEMSGPAYVLQLTWMFGSVREFIQNLRKRLTL